MKFNYHSSEQKNETREYLFSQIPKLNRRKPTILTLPSTNFEFEKMVLKRYPNAKIDCMEINEDVYNQMKNNLPCKVNYELGDIFDKLQDNPGKYDFVWADLCGNLSNSNMNNIISSAQRCIRRKSIFAFTLTAAREQRMKVYADIHKCTEKEFRFKIFPDNLLKMVRIVHPKFSLKKIIQYKSEVNSLPMALYTFAN